MKLLRLKAVGVFSLGDVDFDVSDRGLLLISGYSYDESNANGAGKSSLAQKSIIWGLYGKTPSGSKADDIINIHQSGEHYVEINFLGVDGAPYTVKRERSPNRLLLRSASEDLTTGSAKDTQLLIDKLLGRDFKTYIHTDFFGHGRKNSFFELPASEQRDIIEQILPIDDMEEAKVRAIEAKFSLTNRIVEISGRLDVNRGVLESTRKNYEQTAEAYNNWTANQAEELNKLDSEIGILAQRAKQPLKNKELTDLLRKESSEEFNIDTVMIRSKVLAGVYNKISSDVIAIESNISAREKLKADFSKKSTCPTCGSFGSKKCSHQFIKDLEDTKKELSKLKIVREEAKAKSDECFVLVKTIEAKRLKLKDYHMKSTRAAMISSDLRDLRSKRDKVQKAQNGFGALAENAKVKIKDLEDGQLELTTKLAALNKNLADVSFWERAFSKGLKTMMFDQVCPQLEEKTNDYLELLGNNQIKVQISTLKNLKSGGTKDEFTVNISSSTGGKSYDLLSGGEQQLSSFALGLALADLTEAQITGKSHLLILDEPFTNLSPENCANVVDFLTGTLGKRKSTILLISNEAGLKDLVHNSVHVIKHKGISSIQKETL